MQALDKNGDPMPLNGNECLTPTPTSTSTPDQDCSSDQIVNLVPSYFAVARQELDDMQLISLEGITVLKSPLMNAARTSTVYSWGQLIKVYQRLALPTPETADQVWYEVSLWNESLPTGWIIARYEEVYYTVADDPCASLTAPPQITFFYDRFAAANYAIEHAWQNNEILPIPYSRTTWRLLDNASGLAIPFANFSYTSVTGQEGATGSAVFISEAIWMGGMPMTKDLGQTSCGATADNEGWCFEPINTSKGNPSNPWDEHHYRVSYYTNATPPPTLWSFPIINNVLSNYSLSNKGEQLTFSTTLFSNRFAGNRSPVDTFNNPDTPIGDDPVTDFFDSIPILRSGNISSTPNLNALISAELSSLKIGDFLAIDPYVSSTESNGHGFLVVGWGETVSCSIAMATNQRYTIANFRESIQPDFTTPYVVDFTQTQSPTARPFYCSMYDDQIPPIQNRFSRHDWYFYILRNSLTLPVSQIYVDPNWTWDITSDQTHP